MYSKREVLTQLLVRGTDAKARYILELYSVMEVQHFSTISEAPDDDSIVRNMQRAGDVKNNLKLRKVNFKMLTQVCMWSGE